MSTEEMQRRVTGIDEGVETTSVTVTMRGRDNDNDNESDDQDEDEDDESSSRAFPKSSVYTRTGDKGSTSLYTGERRSKNDPIFEALGTVDELNAHIGLAREHCILAENNLHIVLEDIQSRLFDAGTHIATPLTTATQGLLRRAEFPSSTLKELELKIDELDSQLPMLRNFILPGGGLAASELHVCRTISRRAERLIVSLYAAGSLDATLLKYINRLSDFFFVAARWVALKSGKQEVIYKKGQGLSPNPHASS